MIKIILTSKPTKSELKWCLNLLLDNIRVYNTSSLIKYSKTKSINNKKSRYILAYVISLVGFIMYREENGIMYIYEIHVEERYRNMGIGSKLLNKAKNIAKKKHKKVVLFVDKRNNRAKNFYVKNGMVRDADEEHTNSFYEAYSYTKLNS